MMNSIKFIVIFLLLGMSVSPGLAKSITKTYSAREIHQAISENFQMSEGYFFDDIPTSNHKGATFLMAANSSR